MIDLKKVKAGDKIKLVYCNERDSVIAVNNDFVDLQTGYFSEGSKVITVKVQKVQTVKITKKLV
jgi:hypothetical protein